MAKRNEAKTLLKIDQNSETTRVSSVHNESETEGGEICNSRTHRKRDISLDVTAFLINVSAYLHTEVIDEQIMGTPFFS